MAINGSFRKQLAVLPNGTQRNIYSLVIHNSDWIGSQQLTVVFADMGMVHQASFNIELKSGQTIELDVRNTSWDWCMGDVAIILDKKGKEKVRWSFSPHVYRAGECPECHGTHRCKACDGRGRWTDKMRNYVSCPTCHGTGQCQTCYIPTRDENGESPAVLQGQMAATPKKYHRAVAVIQGEIKRKERELDQVNRDLEKRTNPQPTEVIRNSWPYPGTTVYVKPKGDFGSYTYHLSRRSAQLEQELRELYRELADAESDR